MSRAPVVVLVRHGQTAWARQGRHTGRTDVPLDEAGRQQARALRGTLDQFAPVATLASPLRRAADTARLAGLTATPDPDLMEWDYGGYEGLTTPQIEQRQALDDLPGRCGSGGHPWRVAGRGPGSWQPCPTARATAAAVG